jgi:hypothetical protein
VSSGGGGSSSCYTEWECTYWGSCIGGEQTRDCLKKKLSCKTREDQPVEVQTCIVLEEEEPSDITTISTEDTEQEAVAVTPGITGGVIGFAKTGRVLVPIIFVLGVVGSFLVVKRIRKRKK